MGLGSVRSKVVQERRGQSTCRPWSSAHATYLVPPPSLTKHGQGQSTTQKPASLTLAREHSSEGVNREEEHFRDLQSLGHRPIVVPKVQTSINIVRIPQRVKDVKGVHRDLGREPHELERVTSQRLAARLEDRGLHTFRNRALICHCNSKRIIRACKLFEYRFTYTNHRHASGCSVHQRLVQRLANCYR